MLPSKEKRFLIISVLLSLGFLAINAFPDSYRLLTIFGLAIVTLLLFVFSLWEGLRMDETLLSLILPPLFTLGVGIFWFLIPSNIFARLPVVILYGGGIYVMARTENIFTVSSIKTIPLFRAARGIGFVLTFFTAFLLYNAIISIRADILVTSAGVFLISLFLFLQGLWVSLIERKDLALETMFLYSFVFAFCLTQIAVILYFWPVTVIVGSI